MRGKGYGINKSRGTAALSTPFDPDTTRCTSLWTMAEIEAIEADVRRFLFSTEEAKVVAECVIVHSPQLSDQETKPVFVEERIKRVLAVISNQGNAHHSYEQGW